ncbi:hypothetical protein D3C80_1383030 [compost metagenome]
MTACTTVSRHTASARCAGSTEMIRPTCATIFAAQWKSTATSGSSSSCASSRKSARSPLSVACRIWSFSSTMPTKTTFPANTPASSARTTGACRGPGSSVLASWSANVSGRKASMRYSFPRATIRRYCEIWSKIGISNWPSSAALKVVPTANARRC